jgi:ribosomal protein S18 acetylase RimI-like enzyme
MVRPGPTTGSGVFGIRSAQSGDIGTAVAALGSAFAHDPLMLYLFAEHPTDVRAGAMDFFSILFAARIALNMQAYVLHQAGEVRGAVMGYDTSRPAWPSAITARWNRFEAGIPGFAARLAAYDRICAAHEPGEGHYYLGVIGVDLTLQGQGGGRALLDAFCARSSADPGSRGVYLDTANPASLQFYHNNGFELRGEGSLDGATIWCVYKRT